MPEVPAVSGSLSGPALHAAVDAAFAPGGALARALASPDDEAALGRVKVEVEALCRKFPLYPEA